MAREVERLLAMDRQRKTTQSRRMRRGLLYISLAFVVGRWSCLEGVGRTVENLGDRRFRAYESWHGTPPVDEERPEGVVRLARRELNELPRRLPLCRQA